MKRKIITIIFSILNEAGVNISKKNPKKIWRFIIGMTFLTLAVLAIFSVSVANRNTFYDAVIPFSYAGGGLITMVGICTIFKYNRQVGELFENMDENIFNYPDEDLIPVKYHGIMNEKNVVKLYFVVMASDMIGYILVCSAPLVSLYLNGHITIFIFPYWSPWQISSVGLELIVFLMQYVATTFALWYYYATLMFFIVTIIEFSRQTIRLSAALTSLNYRIRLNNDFLLDSDFSTQINRCIKHHQLLMRNHKLFAPIFSTVFSCELATCTITFALLLYCLIKGTSNFQVIISLSGVALLLNVNFIGRCYIGQKFLELNINIQKAIFYDIAWYQQSKKNQQILIIFHNQASQSFQLFGLFILKANLATFIQMLRVTYSYFNVNWYLQYFFREIRFFVLTTHNASIEYFKFLKKRKSVPNYYNEYFQS